MKIQHLEHNGDFRSEECINYLKQAGIVVTNPPFSLFREYVKQLMDYNKKFIIIGNNNAIGWNEIFKYIKQGKLWLGTNTNKTLEFSMPQYYTKWDRIEDGKKYGKVPAISWFTNVEHKKRFELVTLYKKYNSNEYPKYDNFDAIEVSKTCEIPMDYDGIMGLPITALNTCNPKQFEIVGLLCDNKADNVNTFNGVPTYTDEKHKKSKCAVLNGKRLFARILIKKL